ncbi:MAG: N-acetylneuraminate synthase family protein [Magnetococcales bacterium]|nr:N-acetylneuraminate synthase family protein [Magnetococcales bacterium]MBF0151522.1 N-acetylneuraminate synthase family protein [Magnetococcales bacterium]MBF0173809.1 N-acetylneuraminate synthase family protein [Magnetococcales bacterium]MBF0346753.1 N-acetylneuraminate synthase family protein [Magnetococcales bacterium]
MLFIAEVGMNHNGNFAVAYELIRQAKEVGADIVKFQLGWRWGPGEINQITPEIITELKRWADFIEIDLMFSVIVPEAFTMLQPFDLPRYKVASRTVIDYPDLVRQILATGKETFVSLGFWNQEGLPFPPTHNLHYLWCVSKYPTAPWDVKGMPKDFTTSPFIGYSDHTLGIECPLLAISRGARVIEKHFTLDKSDTHIRDHALSATPEEFARMVTLGRGIARYLGVGA